MRIYWGAWLLILFASGLCAVLGPWQPKTELAKVASTVAKPHDLDLEKFQYYRDYWPTFPRRKIFPYSVIPGGVSSVGELRGIINRNPEIALHLKDFNLERARVVKLDRPWSAYVSYRKGDLIFWTRRRVSLAKGERVITDGKHTVRSRCGNDVSDTPQEPTSPSEPTTTALDTPLPDVPFQPQVPPPPISSLLPPGIFVPVFPPVAPPPPIILPPGGGPPPSGGPPPVPPIPPGPPIATPEPSSLLLFCLGLAGTIVWGIAIKRRRVFW